MKACNRKEKLSALQAAITGNRSVLQQYQQQQTKQVFFMVVCDNGTPKPTDLVDVRSTEKPSKRMPYAEFLMNPVAYGSFCITVDSQ